MIIEQVEALWPGTRYGLGIFQRPLPCGSTYWQPAGDQKGWVTRTGVTDDGRTGVVLSLSGSTQVLDTLERARERDAAVDAVVHGALCSGR
jgi:D-alanyl-D-alanine carboxypeptidase